MVQVDLPAAFTVGQVFAFLSRDYLRREPSLLTHRLLGPLNFFMACCYAPVGMFLLIAWPAWEVMYQSAWFDAPADRPWVAAFYVAFGVIMVVLGNVGFVLAHHWLRHGREVWVKIAIAIGTAATLSPFVLRWGVWMNVGSYTQVVTQGAGYSFWQAPFFIGWLSVMTYMVVTAVAMGLWFKLYGNRLCREGSPPA